MYLINLLSNDLIIEISVHLKWNEINNILQIYSSYDSYYLKKIIINYYLMYNYSDIFNRIVLHDSIHKIPINREKLITEIDNIEDRKHILEYPKNMIFNNKKEIIIQLFNKPDITFMICCHLGLSQLLLILLHNTHTQNYPNILFSVGLDIATSLNHIEIVYLLLLDDNTDVSWRMFSSVRKAFDKGYYNIAKLYLSTNIKFSNDILSYLIYKCFFYDFYDLINEIIKINQNILSVSLSSMSLFGDGETNFIKLIKEKIINNNDKLINKMIICSCDDECKFFLQKNHPEFYSLLIS